MKKVISSFIVLAGLVFTSGAHAAPGDTTWVQAQNNVQLDYYNDFDAAVTFPSGSVSYRKIIMVFTLGKYQCPAGTQYCGDWDYTVQNYLMTPTDTFELSRLITPYANASYPRTPWGWKQRYYFDVTDFYPYLKNNATIRLSYHNYSGGFTGNIRFAFIEGTPPRAVTGIKKLWEGSFGYGEASPIDNQVTPVSVTAPTGTQSAEMRFTVTGHGADNNNCSEFCNRYYQVKQSGAQLQQVNIWKADCGLNNLFPQSGTWIYNRANWCPGEAVFPVSHKFNNITAGSTYTSDVDFQGYTKVGTGSPSYILSGYMIHYGAVANSLDASVEDIISPTDFEGYFRSNPMFGGPMIKVRNTGATTISSISFQYGVTGQASQTYTASGLNLPSMAETVITLPELTVLKSLPAGSVNEFSVTVQQVNASADGYAINNTMKSRFVSAPVWPAEFKMLMKTNSVATQTKWRIEDLAGNIIAQRNPTSANTNYNDAVTILTNGAYRLVVTDAGCDGLDWWANPGAGKGYIYTEKMDGSLIPYTIGLPNYPAAVAQDFGCGYTQYFRVDANFPTGIDPDPKAEFIVVHPNPFAGSLRFTVNVARAQKAMIRLTDIQGRLVYSRNVQLSSGMNNLSVDELYTLPSGMYMADVEGETVKLQRKLVKD